MICIIRPSEPGGKSEVITLDASRPNSSRGLATGEPGTDHAAVILRRLASRSTLVAACNIRRNRYSRTAGGLWDGSNLRDDVGLGVPPSTLLPSRRAAFVCLFSQRSPCPLPTGEGLRSSARLMLWYIAFIAGLNLGLGYLWAAYVRPCPRCAKTRELVAVIAAGIVPISQRWKPAAANSKPLRTRTVRRRIVPGARSSPHGRTASLPPSRL